MNITLSAIEGTLLTAAAVIPLILVLGSVEKILCIIDEIRSKRKVMKQVKLIRENLGDRFRTAA